MNRSPSSAALKEAAPGTVAVALDFRTLFETHFSYVWHTLRRLGVPDRDLEDVAHDLFLGIYRRLDEFQHDRPLRAWLFGFCFRFAASYRRLSRNRHELLFEASEPIDMRPSPVDRLIQEETVDLAHQVLASLALDRRAVFILHELEGCPIPEVARTLGIPVNTAYSRLRLAREDFSKGARRIAIRRGDS